MTYHPLHPMAAHFPIALLLASVAIDLLVAFKPALTAWRSTSFAILLLGSAGAVAALGTGHLDTTFLGAPMDLVGNHLLAAMLATLTFAGLAVWRVVARRRSAPPRALYFAVAALGVVLVVATGLTGGQLVYGHGIGVAAPVMR